ncbi:MAG: hypothetical protein LQ346_001594 [Caloplaca aetnensis]|nr:MAG: hypothetical protein LQ346_001594 [Caloplaca aetnensis]
MNNLPNEILLMIINGINDPQALYAFAMANRRAWTFFTKDQMAALSALNQRSELGRENQRRLIKLLAMRNLPDDNLLLLSLADVSSTTKRFDVRCSAAKVMGSMQSLPFLKEAATISKEVLGAADALLPLMPANKADMAVQSKSVPRLSYPPYPMDMHRVRRALWRLLQYFESTRLGSYRSVYEAVLFGAMEAGELEETICTYEHLGRQARISGEQWQSFAEACAFFGQFEKVSSLEED